MSASNSRVVGVALAVALVALLVSQASALVFPFTSPVFGLAIAPDGSFLVADAGAGIAEVRKGAYGSVATLPGVTDVAPIGRGDMFAVTSRGFGGDGKLYRVSRGSRRAVADLFAFELAVNPDGNPVGADPPSNPFDVAVLTGGSALIADAAGNSLLLVDQRGTVDWIATLPNQVVPTDNAKTLFGCPGSGAPQCGLPAAIPAQGVATSVAIGPDGAFYVGELKGFPAPLGQSRVWRIEPTARHAVCGSSPACQVVAAGFTSIIDLAFGPDGALYVVELDEASWLAIEPNINQGVGGSVNRCAPVTWVCTQIATGLPLLTSAAVDAQNRVFVVTNALVPGAVDISMIP